MLIPMELVVSLSRRMTLFMKVVNISRRLACQMIMIIKT